MLKNLEYYDEVYRQVTESSCLEDFNICLCKRMDIILSLIFQGYDLN